MTTTEQPTDVLLHVDPTTLAIATNVRKDVHLDPEFVASIKERGVLEAITAYWVDGTLTVDRGQRRTLAACRTKRKTVPVLVIPAPAERDSVVDQLTENIHRAAMTPADIAAGVEQLALLGVTEAQIAKRTALPKEQVAAALAVQKSERAQAVATEKPALTLEHLAGIAEFEDDDEAAANLMCAAENGHFEHELQRQRDDRAEQAARAAYADELRAQGVTVVDEPGWYPAEGPSTLSQLQDKPDPAAHTTCPGHAVYVTQHYVWLDPATGEVVENVTWQERDERGLKQEQRYTSKPVCLDPEANGHRRADRGGGSTSTPTAELTDEEREQARTERRELIANNKAWGSACTVRRDWLFSLVARKSAPAGAELFIYRELLHNDTSINLATQGYGKGSGWQSFRDVMGLDREGEGYVGSTTLSNELGELLAGSEQITPKRATLLTAAMILCAWHHMAGVNTWRSPSAQDARILTQMHAWGYGMSEVEAIALQRYEAQQAKYAEADAASDDEDGPTVEELDTTGDPEQDEILEEAALAAAEDETPDEVGAIVIGGVMVARVEHGDITDELEDGIAAADVDEADAPIADEDLDSIA